jgi:hypothetical protein
MITLKNFQKTMTEKAKKHGLYENFGQKEIGQLKDKYGYNHYGSEKERKIANEIDRLASWAENFNMNDLHMALLSSLG